MLRRQFLSALGVITAATVVPWPIRRLTAHIATKIAHPGERITIVINDGHKTRAVTWDPEFRLAGPLTASRKSVVSFIRDNQGHWLEVGRTE